MKNPELTTQGAAKTQQGADSCSLADQRCPDAPLCHRWNSNEGGTYCRLCWRDFTNPKPFRIVEGRS